MAIERSRSDILAQTQLFQKLSKGSLEKVAGICLAKHVARKDCLFYENDKGLLIYILITGSIQLYKNGPDGREIVIKVVKPGEMFGEVILFEKDHYPVNAVALKDSMLYALPKHQFTCLLQNEDFVRDFAGTMMKKMRYLTAQIQYLSAHDVEDRLFIFLHQQYGPSEQIVPNIPKKDIAAALGTTPETLSRLLLRLKKENRLVWEDKKIRIPSHVWDEVDRLLR